MKRLFLVLMILSLYSLHLSWAEEPKALDAGEENEELDIVGMRNPFVSIFYKAKKIIKTPVEPSKENGNNKLSYVAQRLKDTKEKLKAQLKGNPEEPKKPVSQARFNVRIQGLIWNTEKPVAVIDGEVYGIGDSVQKAQITAINKDGIDVLLSGEKIHVSMD